MLFKSAKCLPGLLRCVLLLAVLAWLEWSACAGEPIRFSAPAYVAVTNIPASLLVADLNSDSIADIAVMRKDYVRSNDLGIVLSNGDGTFQPAHYYVCRTGGEYGIQTGDFNLDGKLDLAVMGDRYSNLTLMKGNGLGNFALLTNSISADTSDFVVLDLQKDNRSDYVYAQYDSFNVVTGLGNGSFKYSLYLHVANIYRYFGLIAGDIDGDGFLDLVLLTLNYNDSTNYLTVLTNRADGTFGLRAQYPEDSDVFSDTSRIKPVLTDLNGDRMLDLVMPGGSKGLIIRFNNGIGDFTNRTIFPLFQPDFGYLRPQSLTPGDFNGDGRIDLLVKDSFPKTRFLVGNGDGTFSPGPPLALDFYDAQVGDLNGDGRPDLAFLIISNAVVVVFNEIPPRLKQTRFPGYNQISWLGSGFLLETTTNLALNDWRPFPYPPIRAGNQRLIADWTTGEGKFYRLRKQ